MAVKLIHRKTSTFHDFPYSSPQRKCLHCWIVNVTPPGPNQCIHNCVYCYAREAVYARPDLETMVYDNLPELVERDLQKITLCPPVSISNISDPCQAIPKLKQGVERLIALLMAYGVSFIITTKGDPSFLLAIPGFAAYEHKVVAISIEGTRDILRLLSANAPDYAARLAAVRKLSTAGVKTVVRLDPLFKHLFQALYGEAWFNFVESVIRDFAATGASHIISGTGRLSRQKGVVGEFAGTSSFNRMHKLITELSPDCGKAFEREYLYENSGTGRGYLLHRDMRIEVHQRLRTCAEGFGMTYAVCQELPAAIADSGNIPNCEGYSLPFAGKGMDGKFHPIAGCTANCHVSCDGLHRTPCGRLELVTVKPLRLGTLQ